MTHASEHCWFNGEIVEREVGAPSIASISLHLGTSVFDGLIAYWNDDHYYLHCAEDHLLRFHRGAARMGMSLRWSVDDLLRGVEALLAHEPNGTQYVRPIAYRRAPELWVTGSEGSAVDVSIFTVRVMRDEDILIRCHLSPIERVSGKSIPAQTKVSGAYVNSHYARRTAEACGFHDGLMFDRYGQLAEASAANVFLIRDERLYTPPLNEDVFPGITRDVVLKLAAAQGVDIVEENIHRHGVRSFQGAFLCSTLMELRGVSSLDQIPLATSELDVFNALVASFRRLTHGETSRTSNAEICREPKDAVQ